MYAQSRLCVLDADGGFGASPDAPRAAAGADARRALNQVVENLPSVGLDDVLAAAGLQTRMDRKYLLRPDQLVKLAEVIGGHYGALDIGDRRMFGYESTYFDTADLALYRAHRQGNRRRFKVRSRSYVDSGQCMFEVKIKGGRGETIKYRMPYSYHDRAVITGPAAIFLASATVGGVDRAGGLRPMVITSYTRSTLVDLAAGSRITCDVDYVCDGSGRRVRGGDHVLLETKSTGAVGVVEKALALLGARPVRISKYCVGVALLHPDVPANPWNRTLRREFGWQPQRPA
jgi:hypothetical protein